MATDGLSFPEAVERLAGEAGLELPKSTPEAAAREEKRAGLAEVLELAAKFFEKNLGERIGARGRAYLAGRGIAPNCSVSSGSATPKASASRFATISRPRAPAPKP